MLRTAYSDLRFFARTILIPVVLAFLWVSSVYGDAKSIPPSIATTMLPVPTESAPIEMILLTEKFPPWESPNGKKCSKKISSKPFERVMAVGRVEMGESGTPWLKVQYKQKDKTREGWFPEALLARLPTVSLDQLKSIGDEPVDRFHGMPAEYSPPDLMEIPGHGWEKDKDYKLREVAAKSLLQLIEAAKKEGHRLMIVSAYRSYERQCYVYLNKLERSGWDQATVAMPGHSEHQLGTAVDFTDGDQSTLLESGFGARPAGIWLREHAPEFGFAISYTEANQSRTGYSTEPWHYRYYGTPLAKKKHEEALGSN